MKSADVLVIVGPTASGKSSAGVKIALQKDGEIISADSRQVFQGLDIATGKITRPQQKGVRHYLLDVAKPGNTFSVEDYRTKANQALETIIDRNRQPIVVGGTGFYIDALVQNITYPNIDTGIKLQLREYTVDQLLEIAKAELPLETLSSFDTLNPARLRNRIGLWRTYGHLPQPVLNPRSIDLKFNWYGINPNTDTLRENITLRTDERLDQGMVSEVITLLNQGVKSEWLDSLGLEYRLILKHLRNQTSAEDLRSRIITADLQYAKRQLTWFKRNPQIKWFETPQSLINEVLSS